MYILTALHELVLVFQYLMFGCCSPSTYIWLLTKEESFYKKASSIMIKWDHLLINAKARGMCASYLQNTHKGPFKFIMNAIYASTTYSICNSVGIMHTYVIMLHISDYSMFVLCYKKYVRGHSLSL